MLLRPVTYAYKSRTGWSDSWDYRITNQSTPAAISDLRVAHASDSLDNFQRRTYGFHRWGGDTAVVPQVLRPAVLIRTRRDQHLRL